MASAINLIVTSLVWLMLEAVIPRVLGHTKYFYIPGNGSDCVPSHIPINAVVVRNSNFSDASLATECQMTFEVDDIKPHDLYSDYNSFMAHVSTGTMEQCAAAHMRVFTTTLADHGAYQSFSWSDKPTATIDCRTNSSHGLRHHRFNSGPYIRLIFERDSAEILDFNFNIIITKVKQERFCRWKDFICVGGECIDSSNRCDGVYHCPTGDDEEGCANFFAKWWFVVVNYFTKGSFNTFRIVMIIVIVLGLLLGFYNQRREIRGCYQRLLGKNRAADPAEGSQTPLQQVSSQSQTPYTGHSGSYLDQPREGGYPTEQPSGYSTGYLPVSQSADGAHGRPSGYTYNTESAYTVKF